MPCGAGDSEAFLDQDALFHVSLAQLTGNSFLTDLVIKSNETIRRFHTLSGSLSFHAEEAVQEHTVVLDYLRATAALTSQSRRFVRILSRCSSACLRNNVIDQAI